MRARRKRVVDLALCSYYYRLDVSHFLELSLGRCSRCQSFCPASQSAHILLYLFPQGERSLMAQLGAVLALAASFLCASLFSAVHKIEEGHIGVYYR